MYTKDERNKIIKLSEKYHQALKDGNTDRMNELQNELINILKGSNYNVTDKIMMLEKNLKGYSKLLSKKIDEVSGNEMCDLMSTYIKLSAESRKLMSEMKELSKNKEELKSLCELFVSMGDKNKTRIKELESILKKFKTKGEKK